MKNKYYQRRNKFKHNSDKLHNINGSNRQIVDFENGLNFKRKNINKNHHNAPRLINKYIELAKEALSRGDKILSENYYQHADHFLRITNEKSVLKPISSNSEKENNLENKDNQTINS
tara:strand:+ start:131 stop:481 length:351 start_codon:yes stop_codon:yes gene_type:complete